MYKLILFKEIGVIVEQVVYMVRNENATVAYVEKGINGKDL
jgi:hypothetical protein